MRARALAVAHRLVLIKLLDLASPCRFFPGRCAGLPWCERGGPLQMKAGPPTRRPALAGQSPHWLAFPHHAMGPRPRTSHRPKEPILMPKVRIYFAEFPDSHCNPMDQRLCTLGT